MNDKVLVVDDDEGIRTTLSELISELGYQTTTAADGIKALECFKDGYYLCVFTDIMMPNMSGLELIQEIKSRDISIPVIVITGYASIKTAIDAMKYGASDFLSKPFKIKQIELLLSKVKREKHLLEENKRFSDELHLHRLVDNLAGQLEDKNQEITSLHSMSEKITSLKGIKDLVSAIKEITSELIEDAIVGFYPLNRKKMTLVDPDTGAERALDKELTKKTVCRKTIPGILGSEDYETIFPLVIEGQLFAGLNIVTQHVLNKDMEDKILYLLERTAERMENVALYEGLYDNILSTLNSMAKILDARDPHTSQHSTRVTTLSMEIGKAYHLHDDEIETLYIAASLHDIGKVGIPDSILLKPGPLSDEEFDMIKKHPEMGADIIKPILPMNKEAEIIRHHHERYDGKGYPSGLAEDKIPILSRIIAIADSYDAMTSDRPYRKGMTHAAALEEIRKCSGTQFDPDLTRIFTGLAKNM
ncbi:MAG: response regulator [Thermodesulfobacteriota bacterium]|nr:response regulator [Thermodesulfobacteriota bacterium]